MAFTQPTGAAFLGWVLSALCHLFWISEFLLGPLGSEPGWEGMLLAVPVPNVPILGQTAQKCSSVRWG